ncbi:phage tail assembly chaperone [Rhizobium alvei]|uniref:Uncharacterized protein n=1 Tax=Rhizobium alvei TaxID=1132659 RepID=A0ABT8YT90_9HYPH|nr:hypothetical protein [Rhizobium alvei]MDO6966988.1 hypothetical protein [Rhizobium alvei]
MYERFGRDDLIQTPDIPEEGESLWSAFWALNRRRQHGMNGPQPLTYSEIGFWSRLTGEILLRDEITIIIEMDDAYIVALEKERDAQRVANKRPGDRD